MFGRLRRMNYLDCFSEMKKNNKKRSEVQKVRLEPGAVSLYLGHSNLYDSVAFHLFDVWNFEFMNQKLDSSYLIFKPVVSFDRGLPKPCFTIDNTALHPCPIAAITSCFRCHNSMHGWEMCLPATAVLIRFIYRCRYPRLRKANHRKVRLAVSIPPLLHWIFLQVLLDLGRCVTSNFAAVLTQN